MVAQLVEQARALMRRCWIEQRERFEQVHRRRPGVKVTQALDRRRGPTTCDRAVRVLARDQVEGGRVRDHQHAPQRQHLGVIAAPCCALAGKYQRPSRLRCGFTGVLQRAVGFVGLVLRVGLERDLAPVVRDARRERAGATALELLRHLDGGAPVARALVQRQQREPGFGVEGRAFERQVGGLGAVEQTGLDEILRERMLGAVALGAGQVGAVQQVLVHAHRALELATPAEQVAQREVQIRGVWVLLHRFDEGVDGLVVLFVQQQVQALVVGLRRVLLLALPLQQVKSRGEPAERERQRQSEQQPLQVKVHRVVGAGP